MKANFLNKVHIEGYIFDHDLQKRTSKNGVDYIGGIVNIATSEDAMNVVPVHFIYVTETYSKSGKPNPNFAILEKIIDENNTYSVNGNEAQKVRIDGNIGVNDFVTRDGEMASPKRVVASFIHTMNPSDDISDKSSTFDADMLITSCIEKEVEDGDDYVELGGYVFGYQGSLVPVTFSIRNKAGMKYFLGQDISKGNPYCTELWGNIVSTTVTREEKVESAFGAPKVNVTSRTLRAWDVEGCNPESYEWDDESFITKAELKKCIEVREERLADVRKRNEEYRNSQNGKAGFPASGIKKEAALVEDLNDFPF